MKLNKYCVFVLMATIISCKPILFDAPAGNQLNQFPPELIGQYNLLVPKNSKSFFFKKKSDTVLIHIQENKVWQISSDTIITNLDSTHQIRLLQNKYFVLAKQYSEWQNYWGLFFLVPDKKHLTMYGVTNPQQLDSYFSKNYIGMFQQDSMFVYHQNDSILRQFFEKEIQPTEGIKFIKSTPNK